MGFPNAATTSPVLKTACRLSVQERGSFSGLSPDSHSHTVNTDCPDLVEVVGTDMATVTSIDPLSSGPDNHGPKPHHPIMMNVVIL